MSASRLLILVAIAASLACPTFAFAQEFTSTDYKMLHPVLFPGGNSNSSSFGLTGILSQPAVGQSISTTFQDFGGFLYYPFVSSPVVSATPGSSQVSLSWTPAAPGFGWTVSGYDAGYSTTPGGPYSFLSAGNNTSYAVTGLTNGTAYYFVVRALDAFSNTIVTSAEISSTPVASTGGGGGGGGGGGTTGGGTVTLSGRAYPGSTVTILKDARVVATTLSDSNADFRVNISSLSAANYLFSVYSADSAGRRSNQVSFPVTITPDVTIQIGSIFLSPTVGVDKSEVKKGDDIAIFGQSIKKSNVTIQVNSDQQIFVNAISDASGVYLYNFDTAVLEYGDHTAKSKAATSTQSSQYSPTVAFKVGDQNVAYKTGTCKVRGDLNGDCRVNLVDFSIMAYWYKRTGPPAAVDLNGDKNINLVDFSILAFNWTG